MRSIFAMLILLLTVAVARAEQPTCTGDRHYDGVACCPISDPPPPDSTTTTTTLPDAPCPPVTCQCGDGTNTTTVYNVTVNRCPSVKFPAYAPCRLRKNGKARNGDVIFDGRPYKCPRGQTPQRYFIPQS